MAFAYVANADSHDITVLALGAQDGRLVELERHAAGGPVGPLASSGNGRYLHASIRSEPFHVLSLHIDPATGRLQPIATAPLPASMCWIGTDRTERWLLSAAYAASLVSVSAVGADGRVNEAAQVLPTAANAHCIRTDPSNRFAYAACLGGGVVMQWHFDAGSGRLAPNAVPAWVARSGSGPRHLAFHPTAPVAYLIGELDAGIDVLAIDERRGTLASIQTVSAWPKGGEGAPWAADIHVTPCGRFVHACERRTSTLASFEVDAASGRLTPTGTVATEAQPRGFAHSPCGRYLFAAGQASHWLSRYAVHAETGTLAWLGTQPVGTNPNWVKMVEPPA